MQDPPTFVQQNYEVKFNIAADSSGTSELLEEFTDADLDKLSELLPPSCLEDWTTSLQFNPDSSHQFPVQQSQTWMDQPFAAVQTLDTYISQNENPTTSLPILEFADLHGEVNMVESSLAKMVN